MDSGHRLVHMVSFVSPAWGDFTLPLNLPLAQSIPRGTGCVSHDVLRRCARETAGSTAAGPFALVSITIWGRLYVKLRSNRQRKHCAGKKNGLACLLHCIGGMPSNIVTSGWPQRTCRDAPTPFPKDSVLHPAMRKYLKALNADEIGIDEMVDAMLEMQDAHENDMQWTSWPCNVHEARKTPAFRGSFKVLRSVMRCLERDDCVHDVAKNLLYTLSVEADYPTRLPPELLIECGMIEALMQNYRSGDEAKVLEIFAQLVMSTPTRLKLACIQAGVLEFAVATLRTHDAEPLDQLAALELVALFAEALPVKVLETGVYETLREVSHDTLRPRARAIIYKLSRHLQNK